MRKKKVKISAVIACYNEGRSIPFIYKRLKNVFKKINTNYEIIIINDASSDNTQEIIKKIVNKDNNVLGVKLSRSFNSQIGFSCGLDISTGDAVVLLDGDLQDPPELIEEFYKKWQGGYDVVYGIREKRETVWYMSIFYKSFYRIIWWEPQIGKKEYEYITQVFENNFPNEGRLTIEFENKLARLLKVKHVVAVNNATSAMFLSLKALGIGRGDEVIVPDLTFIATANAVEMAGAKAVLVDIDPTNLTVDPALVKNVITKKTKAIIPVHVSGRGADMRSIISVVKGKNIFIVEDAAEAFMSKQNGKFLGTFGISGCFSLSPAKTITTGQGGFISTNNTVLFKKIKELKDQGRPKRGTGGDDIHNSIGFNFKFTDLQAAVGLGQLTQLEKRIKHIKNIYTLYSTQLKNVKEITLYPFNINKGEFPQWVDAYAENREGLLKFLSENNIDFRRLWFPIHTQKPYKNSDKNFPNSTMMSPKSFWLPSAFILNDSAIKRVCETIRIFYGNK